jgi:hypothetical protein
MNTSDYSMFRNTRNTPLFQDTHKLITAALKRAGYAVVRGRGLLIIPLAVKVATW